jgi:hypothetical protein
LNHEFSKIMKPMRFQSPDVMALIKRRVPAICNGAIAVALTVSVGCNRGPQHASATPVVPAKDGFPHTLAELNAWYVEPPAGQNAATFHLKGLDALQLGNVGSTLPFFGKGQMPPPGAPIPAPMKSALAALMKSNQGALQLFAQGTQFDHCRYPVDLTCGYDAVFRHLKKLDNAGMLVELSALVHADAHQAEQAASDLRTELALANSLANEPTTLAQLLRGWIVGYAVGALEQTVNRTLLPSEASSELSREFQKMESAEARGEGFNRALAGERAMALAALADSQQLLRALDAPDLKMPADRRSQITVRLQKGEKLTAEKEFFETAFCRLMAARQEPFPARLKSDELGRQLVAEALNIKLVVLDLLLPSLGRRTAVEAGCLARLRLGWTAVALEQFRAAHESQYPAALSELAPDYLTLPLADPFDGGPLRYQKKDKGYVLYSIGPDLKDDSGARMNGKAGDIVFSVVAHAKPQEAQVGRPSKK